MLATVHPWDNLASKESRQTIFRAKLNNSQAPSRYYFLKMIFSFKLMGTNVIAFNFYHLGCNQDIKRDKTCA